MAGESLHGAFAQTARTKTLTLTSTACGKIPDTQLWCGVLGCLESLHAPTSPPGVAPSKRAIGAVYRQSSVSDRPDSLVHGGRIEARSASRVHIFVPEIFCPVCKKDRGKEIVAELCLWNRPGGHFSVTPPIVVTLLLSTILTATTDTRLSLYQSLFGSK